MVTHFEVNYFQKHDNFEQIWDPTFKNKKTVGELYIIFNLELVN